MENTIILGSKGSKLKNQINKGIKLIKEYKHFQSHYKDLLEFCEVNRNTKLKTLQEKLWGEGKKIKEIRQEVKKFQQVKKIKLKQTRNTLNQKAYALKENLQTILDQPKSYCIELEEIIRATKHTMFDIALCLENNFWVLMV